MKKSIIFAIFSFFAFFCTVKADTETLNWYVDGESYTTTTCEIGGDVVLPNPPAKRGYIFRGWHKDIFRGTFQKWSDVPSDASLYNEYNNIYIPTNGDNIIVKDTIDYIPHDKVITLVGNVGEVTVTYDGRSENFTFPSSNISYAPEEAANGLITIARLYGSFRCWANADNIRFGNNIYNYGELIFQIYQWNSQGTKIYPNTNEIYTGTWKFVYDGVWETDGRYGWKPVEQIVSE